MQHVEDWEVTKQDVQRLKTAILQKYSPDTLKFSLISLGTLIGRLAVSQIPFAGGFIAGVVGMISTRLEHRMTQRAAEKFNIEKWTKVIPFDTRLLLLLLDLYVIHALEHLST